LEAKTTTKRVLSSILAGIPAFGYLLYLTGRTYCTAYYATIGIPSGIVNYGFWDYIYLGARDFNILIPLAFSAIFVGFVLYLTESAQWYYKDHYSPLEYGLPMFYLVWYAATLLFLVVFIWLDPILKTELAYSFVALTSCLTAAGLSILMLFDKTLLARIKEGRIISKFFFGAIVIALVFFPHTSADAWGRFEGMRAKDSYPPVELHAQYPLIDDIQWETTSTNSFRTVDDLRLVFSNQQYLVVESVTDGHSLYVVTIDDILSIKIIDTENK
jgi:hypothetical protein